MADESHRIMNRVGLFTFSLCLSLYPSFPTFANDISEKINIIAIYFIEVKQTVLEKTNVRTCGINVAKDRTKDLHSFCNEYKQWDGTFNRFFV